MAFAHETLKVYQDAVGVARWFRATQFPRGDADEHNQGLRAARSVVRNIAEGRSRRPEKSEIHHYRIALASAAEACSVLDTVDIAGFADVQSSLREIGAMLRALIRRVNSGELDP